MSTTKIRYEKMVEMRMVKMVKMVKMRMLKMVKMVKMVEMRMVSGVVLGRVLVIASSSGSRYHMTYASPN